MSNLTPQAFEALLSALRPGNREAAGIIYQDLRQGLAYYFERRKCSLADELADATLDRVALKVTIKTIPVLAKQPGVYCLRVARFIYLEFLKQEARKPRSMSLSSLTNSDPDDERRFECMERCLAQLPDKDRQFFLKYRQASAEGKMKMASEGGKTRNAVGLKAHKILKRLEECTRRCFEQSLKLRRK